MPSKPIEATTMDLAQNLDATPIETAFATIHEATAIDYFMTPIHEFLANRPEITEIAVNRPNEVWTEANGQWCRHEVTWPLKDQEQLVTTLAAFIKQDSSDTRPILSAVLPKGERVQCIRSPACEPKTVSITIRKPSHQIRTLDSYSEGGFFDHVRPLATELTETELKLLALKDAGSLPAFLRLAVASGKNIIVAGATGSGKTTFMKALMQEIPTHERLVTIEDVSELFLPRHPNHVHLFYPGGTRDAEAVVVSSGDLLKSCMRMKPDRILLAELRGKETLDFLSLCASGHGGSITSLHAGSCAMAIQRLSDMARQHRDAAALSDDVVRRLIYSTVDIVIHMHNDPSPGGHGRHITEISYEPWRAYGHTTRPADLAPASMGVTPEMMAFIHAAFEDDEAEQVA